MNNKASKPYQHKRTKDEGEQSLTYIRFVLTKFLKWPKKKRGNDVSSNIKCEGAILFTTVVRTGRRKKPMS